ncbi:MAG TPA: alpha/beta hydrolase [Dictyobacter sp.]|nr:alpha/beta hydrolase [Dictyobacter sp.]
MTLDYIHRFVPARNQGEQLPTLLLLHGTGGNEEDLLGLGSQLLPGAALLSPRGKILENGMPRFFRRLAEGVFDVEDLQQRTEELADFILAASQEYHFDPARVIAAGFSNGANIAASMMLLRPDALYAAVLYHPMVPLIPDPLPDLTGVDIFITAGRNDPLIPVPETERLEQLLQQTGATVETHWSESGHSLSNSEFRSSKEWLERVLSAKKM